MPARLRRRLRPHLLPLLRPRRIHAYCVGTPKSGTTTVGAMFEEHYYAEHEPALEEALEKIFAQAEGRLSAQQMSAYVSERDRRLWLEMDASNLNYYFIDDLVKFADARFILTIRDCYTWTESQFNQILNRHNPDNALLLRFDQLRFGTADPVHAPEEMVLKEHGLYRLEGYLSYWARHNRKIIDAVPKERLLVIRTHELSQSIERIAAFLGIAPDTIAQSQHANKVKHGHGLLYQIDRNFLEALVEKHCRRLMDEFFPGFQLPARS
jgi:hypothetical protein